MTVVFRESARKMTLKIKLSGLIAAIGWLGGLHAASFSNVVLQRSEVVPVEYYNYNPSYPYSDSQLAQIVDVSANTAPSLPAVLSPCAAPCVIPNSPISGIVQLPPGNAKIIAYKPPVPSVPVVVTNKEAARGYQYAYAVFDDQTGDKKSQSEHSDGSVVQGQYSFIQPDGVRREVVYIADDTKGFNAVVKNISPEPEAPKEEKVEVVKQPAPPCPDTNEPLTHHHHNEEQTSEQLTLEVEPIKMEEINAEKDKEEAGKQDEKVEQNEETAPPVKSDEQTASMTNAVISYNDIIKCLQAKLQGAKNVVSPLTYVLVPSLSGPC